MNWLSFAFGFLIGSVYGSIVVAVFMMKRTKQR